MNIRQCNLIEWVNAYIESSAFAANFLTFFMYSGLFSLYCFAASTLAGEDKLGSLSIEITEMIIDSTPNIGLHLSSAFSIGLRGSTPGECKIEMQTFPSE